MLEPLADLQVHLRHCVQVHSMRAGLNHDETVVVQVGVEIFKEALSAYVVMGTFEDQHGQVELAMGAQNLGKKAASACRRHSTAISQKAAPPGAATCREEFRSSTDLCLSEPSP